MNLLRRLVDERFLMHRQRSTSVAGIACAVTALVLFEYRLLVHDLWSWDLLVVGGTFAVTKVGLMIWYSLTR